MGQPVDVSDRDALFAFADYVEDQFGGIDIWVSNASILVEKKILDPPVDTWQRILDVRPVDAPVFPQPGRGFA